MAEAPAPAPATPATPPPAPVQAPKAVKPAPRPDSEARIAHTSQELGRQARAAALERIRAAKPAPAEAPKAEPPKDPPAAPEPAPVPAGGSPESTPPPQPPKDEPAKPEAAEAKAKTLQESANQALLRREADIRKREETLKAREQAAERFSKLSEAASKKDLSVLFDELQLNPSEMAQFILDHKDKLGKPKAPAAPPDPRDEEIAKLKKDQEELRAWRQQQADQEAVKQVQGILKGATEYELINSLEAYAPALAGFREYHQRYGSLPVEGDESASLKVTAKELEAMIEKEELGDKFERLLKTAKGRARLEALGFIPKPQQVAPQSPSARAGNRQPDVTLSNAHAREVPPRSDQLDYSREASIKRAKARLEAARKAS